MKFLIKEHSQVISTLFILLAVISLRHFPYKALLFGSTFFVFNLAACVLSIIKKHKEVYLQDRMTLAVFVQNVLVDTIGILLGIALAGLVGAAIAQIAIAQIVNELAKLIAGVLIGLLARIGVGILVQRTWGQMIKTSH